jgi:DNA-binding XRE family transcriptional regulator
MNYSVTIKKLRKHSATLRRLTNIMNAWADETDAVIIQLANEQLKADTVGPSLEPTGRISLQDARLSRGLTQGEVAERIGRSRTTVSNWEGGFQIPPMDIANDLCKLYGYTLDQLFGED